jgi:hypothetical protein
VIGVVGEQPRHRRAEPSRGRLAAARKVRARFAGRAATQGQPVRAGPQAQPRSGALVEASTSGTLLPPSGEASRQVGAARRFAVGAPGRRRRGIRARGRRRGRAVNEAGMRPPGRTSLVTSSPHVLLDAGRDERATGPSGVLQPGNQGMRTPACVRSLSLRVQAVRAPAYAPVGAREARWVTRNDGVGGSSPPVGFVGKLHGQGRFGGRGAVLASPLASLWRPVCPSQSNLWTLERDTIDRVMGSISARRARGSLSDPPGQPCSGETEGTLAVSRHGLNARSDADGVQHGDRRD